MKKRFGQGAFRDATDVAAWRLCVGCGACVAACPDRKLKLQDLLDEGLRPVHSASDCGGCSDCIAVCPGVEIAHGSGCTSQGVVPSLLGSWGPVLEVWEGYAASNDLRFGGSSGGIATALSLFCIEKAGMQGVIHVGNDGELGHRSRTFISRTRQQLLSRTGSRYSPASPCDRLRSIEKAQTPYVFVGKPCDIEGLRKTQSIRHGLDESIGVAIGIFCAGTPSTRGTIDLLKKFGVDHENVEEIRYRGRGWPGKFAVRLKGETTWRDLGSYHEAWGFLQKYRPYRCYLCPDSTSEFADIACGDPWHLNAEDDAAGMSLVLVRTERGREILRLAAKAGYVELKPARPEALDISQKELQRKRGAIWGRLITMKLFGIPVPRLIGFSLFNNWLKIPFGHKARSIFGTARRIIGRRYYKPVDSRFSNTL